jgi:DNA-binding beta-propeller fold protein YncE
MALSGRFGELRGVVLVLGLVVPMCVASPAFGADSIYWSDASNPGSIRVANLDGTGTAASLVGSEALPVGVAIDPATGKIYWADASSGDIRVGNLDGSGAAATLFNGQNNPQGVAIDPATGKIYWANFNSDQIVVANLDGSGSATALFTGEGEPAGVAIDPAAGKIYWADTFSGYIRVGNLTGGAASTLFSGETHPEGVAIDPAAGRIYWTSDSSSGAIRVGNLDGSGAADLFSGEANPEGVAIDPTAGNIYWAEGGSGKIRVGSLGGGGTPANLFGGETSVAFPALLQAPVGAGPPAISGGSAPGATLSCSEGSWAPDQLSEFDYMAPQSFAYAWSENGAPISGASSSQLTAGSAGSYTCSVTASNYAGPTTQTSAAFTVSMPPVSTPPQQVTTATAGDQQIRLTTPSLSACTASTSKLAATLTSTKIARSKGAKLKFSKAAFYIDKGIEHKRHRKGKVVISYSANATKDHVPVMLEFSLAGLKPGTHRLKVVLSYKQTKRKHGHKTTVTISKTMKVKFTVC